MYNLLSISQNIKNFFISSKFHTNLMASYNIRTLLPCKASLGSSEHQPNNLSKPSCNHHHYLDLLWPFLQNWVHWEVRAQVCQQPPMWDPHPTWVPSHHNFWRGNPPVWGINQTFSLENTIILLHLFFIAAKAWFLKHSANLWKTKHF